MTNVNIGIIFNLFCSPSAPRRTRCLNINLDSVRLYVNCGARRLDDVSEITCIVAAADRLSLSGRGRIREDTAHVVQINQANSEINLP